MIILQSASRHLLGTSLLDEICKVGQTWTCQECYNEYKTQHLEEEIGPSGYLNYNTIILDEQLDNIDSLKSTMYM